MYCYGNLEQIDIKITSGQVSGGFYFYGGGVLYTVTEYKIGAIGAIVGAGLNTALGGIDQQITALASLVTADYATGIYAAWKNGIISSRVGYKGMLKKLGIFAAIALANCIDAAGGIHILRSAVLFGFAVVEGTSLLENIDRMGYGDYIPAILRSKLIQIRNEKGV